MPNRQRIATIRKWDNGRTLRWFGVLSVCVLFWAAVTLLASHLF